MQAPPLFSEPIEVFLTIMAIILLSPLLLERLRLPGTVGLILGGILVGPHGLNLLATTQTIELLATVGLIYLMFSVGLEIDLRQFNRVRYRAVTFGLLTFSLPLLVGIAVGRALQLSWPAAALLGSVCASHTLVAFPIVSRLNIVNNQAVSATIGATVFTDVGALLVLAVVAGAEGGSAPGSNLLRLVVLAIAYAALVLFGIPRLGKWFFRRFAGHAVEFQFVLVTLLVAALLAERTGMHAIVGAFLAGLAINATLPSRSAVASQVLFVGQSLFIPIFLMYIGMITDPLAILTSPMTLLVGVAMVCAVYATKFAAAWLTSRIFHYSRDELLTIWGLSQAQAAATLAAILVGVEINLLPTMFFNGAILMILSTCITSPVLVERFGLRLTPSEVPTEYPSPFHRILVPVANPDTEEHLITLASILACSKEGTLLPIHIAQEIGGRIVGLEYQERLLDRVPEIVGHPEVPIQSLRRVDTSISQGILHAAIESGATLIVMGWHGKPTFRQSVFGTVLDEVVWAARVPVLVGRMVNPINSIKRVVLVVPARGLGSELAEPTLEVSTALAREVNVPLLVLADARHLAKLRTGLDALHYNEPHEVTSLSHNAIRDIKEKTAAQDLIVITTIGSQMRFRSSLGQIPEQLAAATACSIAVVHYP
jgi:Kef-type K+ transport system membrane component KefB/nucleotide-binding universal stress UspA family protein